MIGSELKRIRERLKMTQATFAKKIGVASNSVSRWELGHMKITEPVARLVRMIAAAEKQRKG